jgi:predicted metal-dependent enzyme (double-stranded beta helix superfamily)
MYLLESFVADLERITREQESPCAIVDAVKPLLEQLLQNPNCLAPQYRKRGATEYGRYMLHRAPRFNITAIVWGPGDTAKAHNHDTWGLVGVLENEIQETRFRRLDDGSRADYAKLEVKGVLKNSAGMVSCLVPPEDDIHEMRNTSDRNTVEIHVYGKDLAEMPRLRFDAANHSVKIFASPKYQNC